MSAEDLLTRTLRRSSRRPTTRPPRRRPSPPARGRWPARAAGRRPSSPRPQQWWSSQARRVALLDHARGHPGARPERSLRHRSATSRRGSLRSVAFLEGNTFVAANGETVTAPVFRTATTAATIGDGVLVAGPYDDAAAVRDHLPGRGWLDATSRLRDPEPSPWGVATRRTGSPTAAGSLGPGRLFHGTTTTPTAKGVIYSPVGSTSSGVVAVGTLVLRKGAGSSGPRPDHPRTARSRPLPRAAAVTAVSPSGVLVVGTGSLGKGVVSELSTGAVQWRTQQSTLGHFSASGRYVVAVQELRRAGGRGRRRDQGCRHRSPGHVDHPSPPEHRRTSGVGGRQLGAGRRR